VGPPATGPARAAPPPGAPGIERIISCAMPKPIAICAGIAAAAPASPPAVMPSPNWYFT
jgi:hypothetical protein